MTIPNPLRRSQPTAAGPIRNKSLPPKLLEHVEAVFDVIGPYLDTTLDEFEIGFMRDKNPESEVAVWCGITSAWIAYHEKYLGDDMLPNGDEKELMPLWSPFPRAWKTPAWRASGCRPEVVGVLRQLGEE